MDRSPTFLYLTAIDESLSLERHSEMMSLTLNDTDIEIVEEEEENVKNDQPGESDEEGQVVEDYADPESGVFWGKVTEVELALEREYLKKIGYGGTHAQPLVIDNNKPKRSSITGQPKYLSLLATKSVSSKFNKNNAQSGGGASHVVNSTNNFVNPRFSLSGGNCPRSVKKSAVSSVATVSTNANSTAYITPRLSPSGRSYRRTDKKSIAQAPTDNNKRYYQGGRAISNQQLVPPPSRRRSSIKPGSIPRQSTYTVLPGGPKTPKWNIKPLSSSTPFPSSH